VITSVGPCAGKGIDIGDDATKTGRRTAGLTEQTKQEQNEEKRTSVQHMQQAERG
jgi:hypothetical protein